ncbi:MAG: hypothetical protein WBC45_01220 [Atribacterota bacterium]
MKRKVFWVVLFLILAIFLSGCFLEMNTLRAVIIIDDWEQRYFEMGNDQVEIWYKIFNTGNEIIGEYEIWFTAYCEDGSSYQGSSTGYWIDVGYYDCNICFVGIDKNKKVVSVEVTGRLLSAFIE